MLEILKFEADWCKPCQSLRPVIVSVALETGAALRTINIEKDDMLGYKVQGVPTVIISNDDKKETIIGARPKQVYLDAIKAVQSK